MTPERSQELVALFPDLFSDVYHKLPYAMFGFECGDGWFELLKDLILDLKQIVPIWKEGDEYHYNVAQVKEKYGTLRFYMNFETEAMTHLIREAEKRSAQACEECGDSGELWQKGMWIYTRCEKCWNRENGPLKLSQFPSS